MLTQDAREKLNRKIAEALGWTDMGSHPCGRWHGHHNGHWSNVLPDFTRDPAAALEAAEVIVGAPFSLTWHKEKWHAGCVLHRFDSMHTFFDADTPAEALALMCGAVLDAREDADD